MLSQEDHALFSAARAAQILRNNLVRVFTNRTADPTDLIRGGLVRVLLEVPATASEDYAIGIVTGTEEGVAYNGYSPDVTQYTSLHLTLALPPVLAQLNGSKFQLNSVSNTGINESEFAAWKRLMLSERVEMPTIEAFGRAAENIRSLKSLAPPQSGSRAHRSSRASFSIPSTPSLITGATGTAAVANRVSPTTTLNQGQPTRENEEVSDHGGLFGAGVPPLPHISNGSNSGSGSGGYGGPSGAPPLPSTRAVPSAAGGSVRGAFPNTNAVYLARHATTLHQMAGEDPVGMPSGVGVPSPPPVSQGMAGAGGRPPVAGAVALQSSAAPMEPADSKQAELERLVRQDIINHLQDRSALFPKVASDYKLSQLRIVERDMIEYLQHVRDEIANKQVNCVVCLDHVPTVILLPCKHEVLCRLCASTQSRCPICRSAIKEMFEPQEV